MLIKISLIIVVIIVVILIAGGVFLYRIFPPPLSQKETEKDFVKNKDNIMIVTNYIISLKYNNMSILHTDDGKTMFVSGYGHIVIDDSQVIKAIGILFKRGYQVIDKTGNTIYFQRSTIFRKFGSGIVYSIDGHTPDESSIQFLTKLEQLSVSNWYYYEEDYNEWRKRKGIPSAVRGEK
jgi:hypothetical protein